MRKTSFTPSPQPGLGRLVAVVWLAACANSASFAQTPLEPAPRSIPASSLSTDAVEAGTVDWSTVDAAEDDGAETAPGSPWWVQSNLWVWLIGIDGDVGVRGQTADVNASFGDIIDASDSILAFSGRLELGYKRVAAFADGFHSDLGVDNESGSMGLADVDIEFVQGILDFGLMYRVGDWEPSGEAAKNHRNLTLDAYAGSRYTNLEIELRPANFANRSGHKDWFDPIVGGGLVVPIAEHWHLGANGDVGGFGAESDFTWSATGVIGFDFHLFEHPASVLAGYRAIGWDFSDGSGNKKVTWDLVQHGTILGFSMRF